AAEAVGRIDQIFAAERDINGLAAEQRLALRSTRIEPLVTELDDWCGPSAAACRGTPRPPRRSITCSSAGRPSPIFATTAASACQTTPPSALCGVLHSAESHVWSRVPIVAASARRQSTP